MRKIVIPDMYKDGIALLMQLDDLVINSIIEELDKYSLSEDFNSFLVKTIDNLEDNYKFNSKKVIPTIVSFYSLRARYNISIPETIESLIYGLKNDPEKRFEFDETQLNKFKNYLDKLLTLDRIYLKIFSENSTIDYNVFCKMKIVINIQPLSINNDSEESCFSINRLLVIEYYDKGELKEIVFTFDQEGFDKIKECINNEDKSFSNIEKFLNDKKINFIL